MTTSLFAQRLALSAGLLLIAAACGESAIDDPTGSAFGGAGPSGGAPSGGAFPATGGVAAGSSVAGGVTSTGGVVASTGGSPSGGGGAVPFGGGTAVTGGSSPTAGATSTGGVVVSTGGAPSGGFASSGGAPALGGAPPAGGTGTTGGLGSVGGAPSAGGMDRAGGSPSTGGEAPAGGSAENGSGGGEPTACTFTVQSSTSTAIPTVGIVEWSTDLGALSRAQIVFSLQDAGADVLNRGGVAPVDLSQASYRTLLLGLKGQSRYAFHIEATATGGESCTSPEYELSTGATNGAPQISRNAVNPGGQAPGFIVLCGGNTSSMPATIVDADGAVVWWAPAPMSCSRARMDYEGNRLWMVALNVMNGGGEMRWVSMDGLDGQNNVSGLSGAHHDFTVLPGGIVATLVWSSGGMDPESDLVERSPDGTVRTAFRVGANLYAGGPSVLGGSANSYHANSLLYHPDDDSYTIGDRNPNVYVKVSRAGAAQWQLGGNCSGAPAPKCASASWNVNHGHHLLDDGTFLLFSNGAFMGADPSQVFEFSLNTSANPMTAALVQSHVGATGSHSDSLGDVQRLPNGNTLVTFSVSGRIEEFDGSWTLVQALTASSFGYADWRETLYGPPPR